MAVPNTKNPHQKGSNNGGNGGRNTSTGTSTSTRQKREKNAPITQEELNLIENLTYSKEVLLASFSQMTFALLGLLLINYKYNGQTVVPRYVLSFFRPIEPNDYWVEYTLEFIMGFVLFLVYKLKSPNCIYLWIFVTSGLCFATIFSYTVHYKLSYYTSEASWAMVQLILTIAYHFAQIKITWNYFSYLIKLQVQILE